MIELRDIHKAYVTKYEKLHVLKGLDLSIGQGEMVSIMGASGSGKSTLLNILGLLDRFDEGDYLIDGQSVTRLNDDERAQLRNRKFGFVFQSFFLNANDTVLNNVILPLKIAGVGRRERKRRAVAALKTVELDDKRKNKANDLSGGQKQRVCIARAIVNNPEVIFADEPTGNLDSATGAKIEELLLKLNKEQGITVIIVTHDQELANKCSRQIHIKDGKIISDTSNVVEPDDDGDEEIRQIVGDDDSDDWEDDEARPENFEGDNNIDGMLDNKHVVRHIEIDEGEDE